MKKKYIKKISSIFTAIALVFTMITVVSKTYADEKKAVVNIKVQDADSYAGIQGATIQVKKLSGSTGNLGTVLFTAMTDENGKPVKNESNKSYFNESGDVELPLGAQYEVSQTKVPSGYYINQRGKIADLSNTDSTLGTEVTLDATKVDSNSRIISIGTASGKYGAFGVKLYKMKNSSDTDPAKGTLVFDGKTDPYDGKLSDSATIGAGFILNGDLKVEKGHYILKEEKTNRMYKINLSGSATIASVLLLDGKGAVVPSNNNNTTNSNTSGTITNDPNLDYSILSIRKVSSSTNKPLAGATIEVMDNNKKVVFKGKTNSNGVFDPRDATIGKERINDQGAIKLEPGVYFYRETSAPSGYISDTTTHPVNLKKGDIFKVDLANRPGSGKTSGKNGSKLAKTGMESFAPFYVAGGTMLGVGAVMLRNKKRK